jgi:endonuclease-8
MPEGDVVWRTARRLDAALAGRVLLRSDLRWPSVATVDLSGRTVAEVVSAGKHLLTRIAGYGDAAPVTVHSHLKMEGSWQVHRTGERWGTARAASDVRAVLVTDEWTAVGHKLGMLDVVPTSEEESLVGHLGPDVLGPGWDPAEAARRLTEQPDRPVGEALLDQRVLAGVGTFFMAEALFVRGVTPWTPVSEAGDVAALVALVHRMLDFCKNGRQVTTGDTRPGRQQWVHGRAGRPCRRCGTTIRVAPIGQAPRDRVAFYCARCQHGPTPTDPGTPQRPLGAREAQ